MKIFKGIGIAIGLLLTSAVVVSAEEPDAFENVVIYDQDGITFTVKSDELSDWDEYLLNVEVENTTDKDIMVSFQNTCVNGWVCDPFWGTEITAGNKAVEKVVWYSSNLEELGIEDVTEIVSTLTITDSQTWDMIADTEIALYPKGEEAVVKNEREALETDDVLMETDDLSVSVVSFNEKNEWGETLLLLYVNNKSDKNLLIGTDNVAVNGTMCDPFWGSVIPKGKQAYCKVAWYESMLQEKGIDKFEKIDFSLNISDNDTFNLLQTESFSINMDDINIVSE